MTWTTATPAATVAPTSPRSITRYTNISGWDQYRTQFPLLCLLEPAVARDIVLSMLGAYRETGHLPRWQYTGAEQGLMIGDPADAMIADAVAYKVPGIPLPEALAAMVHRATAPQTAKPNRRLVVLIMLGVFLLIAPLPLVRWGRRRHRGRRTNAIAVAYLLLLLSIVELGVSAIPKVPAACLLRSGARSSGRQGSASTSATGTCRMTMGAVLVWGARGDVRGVLHLRLRHLASRRCRGARGSRRHVLRQGAQLAQGREPRQRVRRASEQMGTFVSSADSGDAGLLVTSRQTKRSTSGSCRSTWAAG